MADPIFNGPTTNPSGLTDVGSYASPTLVDIDGDGDLDAFIGNSAGKTLFYRNTPIAGIAAFAAPVDPVNSPNPFGLTDVGSFASPTFADIDGDGDLDAFIGRSDGDTLFYRNTGTASSAAFAAPVPLPPFGLTDVGFSASPTFADIDGDGDLDAFIGERLGNTLFYLNTPIAGIAAFAPPVDPVNSPNPFGLTDVGVLASPTFADIDGDGDWDAFVGNLYGNTLFYLNTGNASTAAFVAPPAGTPNPFGLTDVGYNASPTFADIDGDGDLDAFIGNQSGNTLFFLNNAPAVRIIPTGGNTAVTEGGANDTYTVILNSTPTANVTINLDTTNHQVTSSASTLTFTPANWNTPQTVTVTAVNDSVGEGTHTGVIQHTATSADPLYNGLITNVRIAITDNDLPVADPIFNPPVTIPGLTDVGLSASPTFADIDGDGDLDAFVGERFGNTLFYRNTGNAGTAVFVAPPVGIPNPFGLTDVGSWASPTLVDIDGDGDLDVFIGERYGNTLFYRNIGNASTAVFVTPPVGIPNPFGLTDVGLSARPTFVDIDDDGDWDAFVGSADGNTLFYRNTGNASTAVFVAPPVGTSNPFGLTDVGIFARPTLVDIDGDGDLDAFIGNFYGNTLFYRNTGNASTAVFVAPPVNSPNPFGLTNVGVSAHPTFADIDGDGDWDAFIGNNAGNTLFYRNGNANTAPVLTAPTAINYTDTVFDDTFATATGTLVASDIDSAILTYSITGGIDNGNGTISKSSAYGTLTLTKATGAYSFAPNDAAIEALTLAASASFTLRVSDGALSDSEILTVNIAQTQNGRDRVYRQ